MERRVQLVTDLVRACLTRPPAVTVYPDTADIVAEDFSIGYIQVDRRTIGGTVKGDSYQVFDPLGEEVGPETANFNTAAKQLVLAIAGQRLQRIFDDITTESLAKEWQ